MTTDASPKPIAEAPVVPMTPESAEDFASWHNEDPREQQDRPGEPCGYGLGLEQRELEAMMARRRAVTVEQARRTLRASYGVEPTREAVMRYLAGVGATDGWEAEQLEPDEEPTKRRKP